MTGQVLSDWAWFSTNVRPWFLTIFSAGTLAVAVQFYREWRKGKTADAKIVLDTGTAEDAAADKLRTHYAGELEALRLQITRQGDAHAERQRKADERYDAGMKAADEREEHCQAQVTKLREAVAELTKEVLGLRSALAQTGRSAIILAANTPSLDIRGAADRAATAIGEVADRLHSIPHTETPE